MYINMVKLVLTSTLSLSLLSGCSSNLEIRNSPQTIDPTGSRSSMAAPVSARLSTDTCGASQFQSLVGGPSSAATSLSNIPGTSRHYGSDERVATNTSSRLNFVHSGTAIEALMDPKSTIKRVFCG